MSSFVVVAMKRNELTGFAINLRRSKLELLKPSQISVLQHQNLVSFACQQVLERENEFQVRRRRDVVVTS